MTAPGLTLAAILAACGPPRAPTESAAIGAGAVALPHAGQLSALDEIDAADFVVDEANVLHVVWRESRRGPPPSRRTLYARHLTRPATGSSGAARPAAADTLDFAAGEPARMVRGHGPPSVVAGRRLTYARIEDGAWRSFGPLLPEGADDALAFDAVARAGEVVVAYLARAGDGEWGLFVVRAAGATRAPPRRLAAFAPTPFDSPPPLLLERGGAWHLLCAVNAQMIQPRAAGADGTETVRSRALLVALESPDGTDWSAPVPVIATGRSDTGTGPSEISSLDAVADGEIVAFYTSFGLYSTRSRNGRAWSPPVRLAPFEAGLAGGTRTAAVSAARLGDTLAAAWIDERFRHSDRRWWNPLGGLPWSDAPDWVDNDVLFLRLHDTSPAGAVQRVTPPLGRATVARLRAANGSWHLLWSGRRRVGRRLDASVSGPELFYMRLDP